MKWLKTLLGDPNAREIATMKPSVDAINALARDLESLSNDDLRARSLELKSQITQGKTVDEALPEAFALTREASSRVLKQRHYDVQLMGGIALHRGCIAEMRTGEGKTLTATAPVFLNALTGKGVHVITVNDYLARRDSVWMGQVYHALGLSVACIQHAGSFLYDPNFKAEKEHDAERDETGSFHVDMDYLRPVSRKEAYAADITYGTNNEFGFDYLRDNMVQRAEDMVQRPLHFAVIDEVDSILIDEARTPLIISAPAEEPAELYYKFAELVARLTEKDDYLIDEKMRTATITESGIAKMEGWLNIENLYGQQGGVRMVHHLEQALRAHALFKIDRDYVVREGEVVIVDEFTGRLMQGRRYSEGLHQAIEAKEHVKIQRESVTLATITFQNYFRLYEKLAGMTGTAATEAEEFHKIYKLDVTSIPTHRDNQRKDLPDRVYKTELGKFKAVVADIKARHEKGQPVLVGTVSIEKNELLSALLKQAGIPHGVLNAKNHEREAEIIAQAGSRGAVTVATNMAGRGVDIILGGNPPDKAMAEEVRALGGLHVVGTERHESRRIDNQLRGRSGRQGDPGSTQFYLSMEDDLMRIFGSDRMKNMLDTLGLPEDEAIENKILTRSIETAQKKVEGHHFDIRKHLLEYDDVLNKHRTVLYKRRREILEAVTEATQNGERPLRARTLETIDQELEGIIASHTMAEDPETWEIDKLQATIRAMLPSEFAKRVVIDIAREPLNDKEDLMLRRTRVMEAIQPVAREAYTAVEEHVGDVVLMADIEKSLLLRATDDLWIEHLEAMDYLRHSIGLQGYGQRDPLVEYKRESFRMFNSMLASIGTRVAHAIFHVHVERKPIEGQAQMKDAVSAGGSSLVGRPDFKDIGRNDACPCGSGKKFKKCHGA